MLDEMMWQGIEAGYRRLAASQAEMRAYQAEAAFETVDQAASDAVTMLQDG